MVIARYAKPLKLRAPKKTVLLIMNCGYDYSHSMVALGFGERS